MDSSLAPILARHQGAIVMVPLHVARATAAAAVALSFVDQPIVVFSANVDMAKDALAAAMEEEDAATLGDYCHPYDLLDDPESSLATQNVRIVADNVADLLANERAAPLFADTATAKLLVIVRPDDRPADIAALRRFAGAKLVRCRYAPAAPIPANFTLFGCEASMAQRAAIAQAVSDTDQENACAFVYPNTANMLPDGPKTEGGWIDQSALRAIRAENNQKLARILSTIRRPGRHVLLARDQYRYGANLLSALVRISAPDRIASVDSLVSENPPSNPHTHGNPPNDPHAHGNPPNDPRTYGNPPNEPLAHGAPPSEPPANPDAIVVIPFAAAARLVRVLTGEIALHFFSVPTYAEYVAIIEAALGKAADVSGLAVYFYVTMDDEPTIDESAYCTLQQEFAERDAAWGDLIAERAETPDSAIPTAQTE